MNTLKLAAEKVRSLAENITDFAVNEETVLLEFRRLDEMTLDAAMEAYDAEDWYVTEEGQLVLVTRSSDDDPGPEEEDGNGY